MVWNRFYIGDACLCWQRGNAIDAATNGRVIHLYRQLKSDPASHALGIHDVVPSYNAVAVHFDPDTSDTAAVIGHVDSLIKALPAQIDLSGGQRHTLPVRYDGPDLPRVAAHCGLPPTQVMQRHTQGTYHVAMIGFRPHFPYLIGLDPRLETPRLPSPRIKVPAGSVAIGGAQTGIYPCESPGGWNIIGSADPELLIPVQPGDTIRFSAVGIDR